jgi:hypothetical protein
VRKPPNVLVRFVGTHSAHPATEGGVMNMNEPTVKIGDWYLDRDKHDFLCVIGVHTEEGVVDIRDEYGDVDEIDFDEWESMDLVLCSSPVDWKTGKEWEAEEES